MHEVLHYVHLSFLIGFCGFENSGFSCVAVELSPLWQT